MLDSKKYHEINKNRPIRPLVLSAVQFVVHRGRALDLGAGALKESKFLADLGFDVTAVDEDPLVLEFKKEQFQNEEKIHVVQSKIEDFEFVTSTYDFIWSYHTLPHLKPEDFELVIHKIISSLTPGGIFAGTFFGIKDSWNAVDARTTFVSQLDLERLFESQEIIKLNEMEEDKHSTLGGLKHWHVFRIIAKKKL